MIASITSAKTLGKLTAKESKAREEAQQQARLVKELKRKQEGMTGERIGRHVVKQAHLSEEVQLTEDLSESFRAIKVCICGRTRCW